MVSKYILSPTSRLIELYVTDTPVTEISLLVTLTLQVAVYPPSTVVTVTIASPSATPVNKPLEET